ncbi:MAG: ATP-binding cassette domain-containing protein, partial [Bacteroidaceae bacterium]|nr:ATP-binding cassette domain-containing protein [Bacteroidaceae bacterium]
MAENLLTVENIGKSFGEKILFEDLCFGVNKGQKIALVAKNGQGKSTLLNIIAGKIEPDEGKISFRSDIHSIYLEQNPLLDTELTVIDVVFTSDNPKMTVVREYEEALIAASKQENEQTQTRLSEAISQMDRFEVWDYEAKAKEILSKLG